MREVSLGDVLFLERNPERLEPDAAYATVGILSYGRGLFARPVVHGRDVSYSTYYRLRSGQFVYSKLFAWEGALAVVDDDFDGLWVSQEFPTFGVRPEVALPSYVHLLCTWPTLWQRVRAGESGMGGRRKRVHPDRLLEVKIPLPPIAQQRRIVDLVAAVDDAAAKARGLGVRAHEALRRFLDTHLGVGDLRRLGDLVEMRSGPSWTAKAEHSVAVDGGVPVIGITNTKPDGRLDLADRRFVTGLSKTVRRLTSKSLILIRTNGNRDRIGNVYRVTPEAIGSAVSAFQIAVEPHEQADAAFLYWMLRSPQIQALITDEASGSTGLGNIAIGWLRELNLPWPVQDDREAFVAQAEDLANVQQSAENEASALAGVRAALLGELLCGGHEIPPTYDVFLEAV